MAATLTVVIPTRGRPSLWATLASLVDQLEDGDEAIVVADSGPAGCTDAAIRIVNEFQPAQLTYLEASAPGSLYGNAQRDVGMAAAPGSHLCFIDDDDVYENGALDLIRDTCEEDWNAAHVFRARWGSGHPAAGVELWRQPEVREQNIATPMVVLPNRVYARGWMDGNHRDTMSDFAFLAAAIAECDSVCWHPDVVATVRP